MEAAHPVRRIIFVIPLYPMWLAMMAVHEAGHALTAVVTGGKVANVSLPLFGFSQTDLAQNPHPALVAWGGPMLGGIIPLTVWLIANRFRWRANGILQFFAGFCLVINGAYIGIGWTIGAGDAGDMHRYGTPKWPMALFGAIAFTGGMYLWHRLGSTARIAS